MKYETVPSIEYKFITKGILPLEERWWKRGTHRYNNNHGKTEIITP